MIIIFAILLTLYVGIPILFLRTKVFGKKPMLRQISSQFFPNAVQNDLDSFEKPLGDQGFEHRFDAVANDQIDHVRVFFRTYLKKSDRILAIVTSLLPDGSEEKPLTPHLEFLTKFGDNTEIVTNNNDLMGAPIEPTSRSTRSFPNIKSPVKLLQIHKCLVDRSKKSNISISPKYGDVSCFEDYLEQELQCQVRAGGLRFDSETGSYRPTIAGAFLMAWNAMWPISFIRRTYLRQKARFLLRLLNIEST